jgi:hypothetical protein
MMGNPYMKVVKHHDAAKDAIKDQIIRSLFKKVPPRPRDFRYSRVPLH